MSEGAANLVDHVLLDVPNRQFALTLPFPASFPLAFDGKLPFFLDGVFHAAIDGEGRMFHPAPVPRQEEVDALVEKATGRGSVSSRRSEIRPVGWRLRLG